MINKILIALDDEMKSAAQAAVTNISPDVSMFEYGRKVGFYQGLEHAKARIEDMLRSREDRDQFL